MLARRFRYERHILLCREYPLLGSNQVLNTVPTLPRPNLFTATNAKTNAWRLSKHILTLSVAIRLVRSPLGNRLTRRVEGRQFNSY